jgi:hypothetical protein
MVSYTGSYPGGGEYKKLVNTGVGKLSVTGGAGKNGAGGAGGGAGGYLKNTSAATTGAYAYGGAGGRGSSIVASTGGRGGKVAYAYAFDRNTSPSGLAQATAFGDGGTGGTGYLSGGVGGAGGSVQNVGAAAYGHNVTVEAIEKGGDGGTGMSGASGGAGASSSLVNAVKGSTSGGYLDLLQEATGGTGGYAKSGSTARGGKAGSATSSLTFSDLGAPIKASTLGGTIYAGGGTGGGGAKAQAGGNATAYGNLTGAGVVESTVKGYAGAGGNSSFKGANGGVGKATSIAETTSSQYVGARAIALGGNGGQYIYKSGVSTGGKSYGGAGGAAVASASATGNGLAVAFADAVGGAGGDAGFYGFEGGQGASVSGSNATARGHSAYADVSQTGGAGGYAFRFHGGGVGGSSTLTNAAMGSADGGSLKLRQGAYGGAGGHSINSAARVSGGSATSNLTFNDSLNTTHAGTLTGLSYATGGAGGYSYAGGAGGAANAGLNLTGAGGAPVVAQATAQGGKAGEPGGFYRAGPGGAANASVTASSGGALTANAIAHGGYSSSISGIAKATVSATGPSGTFSALADTSNTPNVLVSFVSAQTSGQVNGASSALAQTRIDGVPFAFTASGQGVAIETGAPRGDTGLAVLNANPKIKKAFGAPPHEYFGIGELGGGYAAGGSGTQTVTSVTTLTVAPESPGTLDLELGLYNGDLVGSGVTSVSLTVADTTNSKVLLSRPGMTAAQAKALFTNDGFANLEQLTSSASGSDTLKVTLSVQTDSANSGFYGDFIIGDTQAAPSPGASVQRMATAMAGFAPTAGGVSAHSPSGEGSAAGAAQLATPIARFA